MSYNLFCINALWETVKELCETNAVMLTRLETSEVIWSHQETSRPVLNRPFCLHVIELLTVIIKACYALSSQSGAFEAHQYLAGRKKRRGAISEVLA